MRTPAWVVARGRVARGDGRGGGGEGLTSTAGSSFGLSSLIWEQLESAGELERAVLTPVSPPAGAAAACLSPPRRRFLGPKCPLGRRSTPGGVCPLLRRPSGLRGFASSWGANQSRQGKGYMPGEGVYAREGPMSS